MKVYNSQTSKFNLTSDEINYSTQILSKKHAANKTTTKFFASRSNKLLIVLIKHYQDTVHINFTFSSHQSNHENIGLQQVSYTSVHFSELISFIILGLFYITGTKSKN